MLLTYLMPIMQAAHPSSIFSIPSLLSLYLSISISLSLYLSPFSFSYFLTLSCTKEEKPNADTIKRVSAAIEVLDELLPRIRKTFLNEVCVTYV